MNVLSRTRRAGVVAFALAGLLAGLADTASAAIFRGQISDPSEHPADPSRDITNVAATFDSASGRWTVSVTFAAAPTAATSARLYLGILVPAAQCPLGAGGLGMLVQTGGGPAGYSQNCRQGTPRVVRRSLAGRTLTLQVTDPAAIGLTPEQLGQTRLSRHRVYDYVPATRLFGPTAAAALRVGPGTRFRITPGGTVNLPLSGVSRTARASIRLTAETTVLARRTLTVKPGLPKLRLHLSAAARRHIRAGATRATLTTTLTDSTGQTRSITQTITLLK
jgi:hypothetical protein